MRYNLWQIHKLLTEGFSKEDLLDFCAYESGFKTTYDDLDPRDPKSKILRVIIDHALRRDLIEQLLTWAETENPARFARHQPYIIEPGNTASPVEPASFEVSDYYSCFIVYDPQDEFLAEQIYQALTNHKITCWYAPEDARWGDKRLNVADIGIPQHDKLLIILSASSIENTHIESAVMSAIEVEEKCKEPVLFPIRADDAVMNSQIGWAAYIRRARFIGDFSSWQDEMLYERGIRRLLRNLARDE